MTMPCLPFIDISDDTHEQTRATVLPPKYVVTGKTPAHWAAHAQKCIISISVVSLLCFVIRPSADSLPNSAHPTCLCNLYLPRHRTNPPRQPLLHRAPRPAPPRHTPCHDGSAFLMQRGRNVRDEVLKIVLIKSN